MSGEQNGVVCVPPEGAVAPGVSSVVHMVGAGRSRTVGGRVCVAEKGEVGKQIYYEGMKRKYYKSLGIYFWL